MSRGSRKKPAPKGCYWRENTLWGRVHVGGKEFRESLDTDEPKVARERRAALEKRLKAVKHGDARLTYAEVFAGWLEWLPRAVPSPRTVGSYTGAIDQIAVYLADKYFDEIDDDLLLAIIRARRKQGVTEATIKRGLVALSSMFNFAFDEGLWKKGNPVIARMKRIKEFRDPIILPRPEDIEKVVARCALASPVFALMVEAARLTGARQEELAGALRRHLELPEKRLTLIGKRNKLRVIDLEVFDAWKVFARLPIAGPKSPLFFHGKGERFENIASRFAGFTREIVAGDPDFIRFRFHDLRHLHAVEWLRSGRSIYDLQWRLGHSSIKVTEMYLKYRSVPGTKTGTEESGQAGGSDCDERTKALFFEPG